MPGMGGGMPEGLTPEMMRALEAAMGGAHP
jgi:hypothetical protein